MMLGSLRIDPNVVIVVAARRALDRDERLAAVGRAIRRRVRQIDGLRIARIDRERNEVVAALRDLVGVVDASEVRAGVVAAIERAGVVAVRFDVGIGVDDVGVARRDRDFGAADARRQPVGRAASTSFRRRSI